MIVLSIAYTYKSTRLRDRKCNFVTTNPVLKSITKNYKEMIALTFFLINVITFFYKL